MIEWRYINPDEELRAVDRWYERRIRRTMSSAYVALASNDHRRFDVVMDRWENDLGTAMVMSADAAVVACRRHKARVMWSAAKVDTVLRKLTSQEKRALRELYGSVAKSVTGENMSAVRERMLKALGKGRKTARGLLKVVDKTPVVENMLRTVGRTQTSMAFTASVWGETSSDPDLWGYEYGTAGDDRVRLTHSLLNGMRARVGDAVWDTYAPPNGWNCRCGLTPVYVGTSQARRRVPRRLPSIDSAFAINVGKIREMLS